MGKKSKAPAAPPNQTVNQYSSNLPEYAKPYYTDLLKRGQAESNRGYTPYQGQRLAGFTPGQVAAQNEVFGMQRPGQFDQASGLAGMAAMGSVAASQYDPTSFSTPLTSTAMFTDPNVAQQYMSPYMQNVLDVQKREALRDAQIGQLGASLGSARQGTYGGARQLLATTERERNLQDQMARIQATGMQSAYDAALGAFQQDQGRLLQSNQGNQQAILNAQQMAEQSRQFGSTLGLQGLSQALTGAGVLGDLGTATQAADLQRIQAQAAAGAEQQNLQQQGLDIAYADFLRQRDYPKEQLNWYAGFLGQTPTQMSSTQTSYAPPPSLVSQVGGLGLAGLGLSQLLK